MGDNFIMGDRIKYSDDPRLLEYRKNKEEMKVRKHQRQIKKENKRYRDKVIQKKIDIKEVLKDDYHLLSTVNDKSKKLPPRWQSIYQEYFESTTQEERLNDSNNQLLVDIVIKHYPYIRVRDARHVGAIIIQRIDETLDFKSILASEGITDRSLSVKASQLLNSNKDNIKAVVLNTLSKALGWQRDTIDIDQGSDIIIIRRAATPDSPQPSDTIQPQGYNSQKDSIDITPLKDPITSTTPDIKGSEIQAPKTPPNSRDQAQGSSNTPENKQDECKGIQGVSITE